MTEKNIEMKGLPHHDEAERVLLGSMMLDNDNIALVLDVVKPDAFYRKQNRLVFEAIVAMFERNEEVDPVLVSDELIRGNTLQDAGGYEYIDSLTEGVPRTTNVAYYASIIKQKQMLRNLAHFGQTITQSALEAEASPNDLIAGAETSLFDLREGEANHGFQIFDELLDKSYGIIQERATQKEGLVGLTTGFLDFDKVTSGLQKGDLIIVAARPAMGKTSFCLNLAVNAALKGNARVAVYSLEMPATQLTMRLLGSEARVSISALRAGQLRDHEWSNITQAVADLRSAQIFIDDTGDSTVAKMRSELKRISAEAPVDLVVIDYLQLMSGSSLQAQQSRVQEVSAISRGLKVLAKEIDCPVIALSQLSRAAEQRSDHRPQLSDLRESGSIEQDADMVCFLFREDYYNQPSGPDAEQNQVEDEFGLAELIIAKHRNGPTGSINLAFFKKYTRFENYSDELDL